MIVALPNLLNWKYRLRLALGVFEYERMGTMDNTHFRWYTYKSAEKLLKTNGLNVVKSIGDGHFPMGALRAILPRVIVRGIDLLFLRISPGLFSHQLVYVAKAERGDIERQA